VIRILVVAALVFAATGDARAQEKKPDPTVEQLRAELEKAKREAEFYKEQTEKLKKLLDEKKNAEVEPVKREAELQRVLAEKLAKELKEVQKRNFELEDGRVKLVLEAEEAKRQRLRAENEAKLARSSADEQTKKIEALFAKFGELKFALTDVKNTGEALTGEKAKKFEEALAKLAEFRAEAPKAPPMLPKNLRGKVTKVAGDLVELSIGIDAGLEKGVTLDLYRAEGGGKYLGTVVVREAAPKTAIASFKPARDVAINQLRPEELPKKDDEVIPQKR
jgi:hypothetical protein